MKYKKFHIEVETTLYTRTFFAYPFRIFDFFVAKKFIAIFFNVWKLKKKSLPYFNVENIFVAKKSNKKIQIL